MSKKEIKKKLMELIKQHDSITEEIKEIVFNYAKMEGLVSASCQNSDSFGYKKIIREEFDLVI